jgi:hypothetical protein
MPEIRHYGIDFVENPAQRQPFIYKARPYLAWDAKPGYN